MYVLFGGGEHMKLLVIENDNGVKGQHGFSDEEILSDHEIDSVIKSYENHGITVYGWKVFEQ